VVTSGGTLSRGSSGALSVRKLATGLYEVHFNRDVSGCAYEATLGLDEPAGTMPEGFVSVAPGGEEGVDRELEWVFVSTKSKAGAATSLPFHLGVFC
jgi:hypothetical protein